MGVEATGTDQVECAGEFLVTAGDNPDRLRSEAAFAMANAALHMVVCRIGSHESLRRSAGPHGTRPALVERALAIREKVLEPDHPNTAASRRALESLASSE